ncbi:MAG: helix-turn-helix domain-containing protein [Candidatus Woesearchaeota archaeon]
MNCELCGKQTERLNLANIESTKMNVCEKCLRLGTKIKKPKFVSKNKFHDKENQPSEVLKKNYYLLIQKQRQKKYDQETFAKKLGEKLSTIQRIEKGELNPSSNLIKKIESQLDIKLTEKIMEIEKKDFSPKKNDQTLTLGDLIKFKKK